MQELTSVKRIKSKRIAYSKNILDDIDYIDNPTCYELVKSLIPSELKSTPTPYLYIRKLLNFFDKHEGANGKLKSGRRFMGLFLAFDELVDLVNKMNRLDNEIIGIVYQQHRKYSSSELVEQIKWRMEELLTTLRTFMVKLDKSGITYRFYTEEVITGSQDGRRVGLLTLLFKSNTNMEEIVSFLSKLEQLARKGKNPMSYNAFK